MENILLGGTTEHGAVKLRKLYSIEIILFIWKSRLF